MYNRWISEFYIDITLACDPSVSNCLGGWGEAAIGGGHSGPS